MVGQPADGHGGIFIEAPGSPFNTWTSADGQYRLAVSAGIYDLRLGYAGYQTGTVTGVEVGAGEVIAAPAVDLAGQPGRVIGQIAFPPGSGASGAPPDGDARLFADEAPAEAPPLDVARPAADGTFAFASVVPAHYRIEVGREHVTLETGDEASLGIVALRPELSVSTPTLLVGRALLEGVDVHDAVRIEVVGTPFVTGAASDGRYQLIVSLGRRRVRAWAPGYAAATFDADRVQLGEELALPERVLVRLPARFEGIVMRETADGLAVPAVGTTVSLPDGEGLAVPVAQADARGRFAVEGVPQGFHELHVALPRHAGILRPAFATAGETADVGTLTLRLERGAVFGRVRGPEAAAGISVIADGVAGDANVAGLRRVVSATPPDGAFRFDDLPVGVYAVTAVAPNHVATGAPAERRVVADEGLEIELGLRATVHRLEAPGVASERVQIIVERDPDLTFAQLWIDGETPPADAAFFETEAGATTTLDVDLPREGAQRMRHSNRYRGPQSDGQRAVAPRRSLWSGHLDDSIARRPEADRRRARYLDRRAVPERD